MGHRALRAAPRCQSQNSSNPKILLIKVVRYDLLRIKISFIAADSGGPKQLCVLAYLESNVSTREASTS